MRKWKSKTDQLVSYQIEIKMKEASSELAFEELWIDDKRYNFHLTREGRKIAGSFQEKEILKLNIISEIKDKLDLPLPSKSSKGIMVLNYTFRSKKKFLCIKKFRDIDGIHLSGL
jgi:hypothetical protein